MAKWEILLIINNNFNTWRELQQSPWQFSAAPFLLFFFLLRSLRCLFSLVIFYILSSALSEHRICQLKISEAVLLRSLLSCLLLPSPTSSSSEVSTIKLSVHFQPPFLLYSFLGSFWEFYINCFELFRTCWNDLQYKQHPYRYGFCKSLQQDLSSV